MTTATTVALFARQRATWGIGPRSVSPGRTGGMAGVSSRMESRADDTDFAYIFNTRSFVQSGDPLDDFHTKLSNVFATVNIPAPQFHL